MWTEKILSVFATGLVLTENILRVFKFIRINVDRTLFYGHFAVFKGRYFMEHGFTKLIDLSRISLRCVPERGWGGHFHTFFVFLSLGCRKGLLNETQFNQDAQHINVNSTLQFLTSHFTLSCMEVIQTQLRFRGVMVVGKLNNSWIKEDRCVSDNYNLQNSRGYSYCKG